MNSKSFCLMVLCVVSLVLSGCFGGFLAPLNLEIPDQRILAGEALHLNLKQFVNCKESDDLVFRIVSGVGIIDEDVYSYLPALDESGLYEVQISVNDSKDRESSCVFEIIVDPICCEITLNASPLEGGVTSGGGIFQYGDMGTVQATPSQEYSFTGWYEGNDCLASTTTFTFFVERDATLVACFFEEKYHVIREVNGNGSIEISPDKETYSFGEKIILTAHPSYGWKFSEWVVDGTRFTDESIVVVVDGDKSVYASFEREEFALNISISGNGSVSCSPASSGCVYEYETLVEIVSVPSAGWEFEMWQGDLDGFDNPGKIIMDSEKHVTAVFVKREYLVEVTADPPAGGVVEGGGCYSSGSEVEIVAVPNSGYRFKEWSENGATFSRENKINLIVSRNFELTAHFEVDNAVPVVEKLNGPEGKVEKSKVGFVWNGTDPDGFIERYEYREDGGDWIDIGTKTYFNWSGYLEGPHTFEVRARDNQGAYSETVGWSFVYVPAYIEQGAFKVANSWGTGGWENIPDGFIFITYEAMKQNEVLCFVLDPRDNYEPRAIAVFEISHPLREECKIWVGAGDPANPLKLKSFDDFYYRGGGWPYPANKMVIDITELLPFDENTVFLKVFDGGSMATGVISHFSVEVYDNYPSGSPVQVFSAVETPKDTMNGSYVSVSINDVSVSSTSIGSSFASSGLSTSLLLKMKETLGIYEEGVDYNEIIEGHGTGLRPPSEEEWRAIESSWHEIEGFSPQDGLPYSVDHSGSVYFPPIGNQGSEGSCVAFSLGYYTSTFYEARDRNWNLSGAAWEGGFYGAPSDSYQDRIFSPDFVYHQINGGRDTGCSYVDAINLIARLGICSWRRMPYSVSDHTSWPLENAWREAPRYRSRNETVGVISVEDDQDINALKSYISSGYLISISIDASKYAYLTANDVWNTKNYTNPNTNHANTIVGYDDTFDGTE